MMRKRSRTARHSSRDPDAIVFARNQRVSANEFARAVWQMVRNRGCRNQKFRREYPIPPYTADFCCVALKLILEVDGEHHQTDEGREHDKRRDRYLAEQGYTLLRIPGYQITQDPASVRCLIETTIDERIEHLGPLTPSPSPPAAGGEGRRK
jgi:very-short-patch-repair endonuclease